MYETPTRYEQRSYDGETVSIFYTIADPRGGALRIFHREDGPASIVSSICRDYTEEWYIDGNLHRTDGPAVIRKSLHSEVLFWYRNGKRHREDGPAVIETIVNSTGTYESEYWYANGKLHRVDGPSFVEKHSGIDGIVVETRYYLNGVQYDEHEYNFQVLMRYSNVK